MGYSTWTPWTLSVVTVRPGLTRVAIASGRSPPCLIQEKAGTGGGGVIDGQKPNHPCLLPDGLGLEFWSYFDYRLPCRMGLRSE